MNLQIDPLTLSLLIAAAFASIMQRGWTQRGVGLAFTAAGGVLYLARDIPAFVDRLAVLLLLVVLVHEIWERKSGEQKVSADQKE